MRKLLAASAISLALMIPLNAGEVSNPGAVPTPTPPCNDNCASAPSTWPTLPTLTDMVIAIVVEVTTP